MAGSTSQVFKTISGIVSKGVKAREFDPELLIKHMLCIFDNRVVNLASQEEKPKYVKLKDAIYSSDKNIKYTLDMGHVCARIFQEDHPAVKEYKLLQQKEKLTGKLTDEEKNKIKQFKKLPHEEKEKIAINTTTQFQNSFNIAYNILMKELEYSEFEFIPDGKNVKKADEAITKTLEKFNKSAAWQAELAKINPNLRTQFERDVNTAFMFKVIADWAGKDTEKIIEKKGKASTKADQDKVKNKAEFIRIIVNTRGGTDKEEIARWQKLLGEKFTTPHPMPRKVEKPTGPKVERMGFKDTLKYIMKEPITRPREQRSTEPETKIMNHGEAENITTRSRRGPEETQNARRPSGKGR